MYPLETLNEIFPKDYQDTFYRQFKSPLDAWQNIVSEFILYAHCLPPQYPDTDYSQLAAYYAQIESWPYPERGQAWKCGDYSWREISRRIYWQQLECVPPARMRHGCFMVGEPYTHNENGAVYTAFVEYQGRYFCRHDNGCNFNPIQYKSEVCKQFDIK